MTDYTVTQGSSLTVDGASVGQVCPPWLQFASGDQTHLKGVCTSPEGVYRLRTRGYTSGAAPASLAHRITVGAAPFVSGYTPSFGTEWTVVIRHGANYLWQDGTPDAPLQCIGTPEVRLSKEAPGRAVVRFPEDTVKTVSSATWSSGGVDRGMSLEVYLGAYRIFLGRIFEVSDDGHYATVTAYDRVMDLTLAGSQYLVPSGSGQHTEASYKREEEDENTWRYTYTTEIGTVQQASAIDLMTYTGTGTSGIAKSDSIFDSRFCHTIGFRRNVWDTMSNVRIQGVSYYVGCQNTGTEPWTASCEVTFKVRTRGVYPITYRDEHTVHVEWTAPVGTVSYQQFTIVTGDVEIGPDDIVYITVDAHTTNMGLMGSENCDKSKMYIYTGANYEPFPDVAIEYRVDSPTVIAPASVHPQGYTATIAKTDVAVQPPEDYTVADGGAALILTYLAAGSMSINDIVGGLVSSAGCDYDGTAGDLGNVAFYDTSTYDALTSVLQFVRPKNMGIIDRAGVITLLPRHTIDESGAVTYTTEGDGSGAVITSHSLTMHWMADKATWAIISQDSAGTPMSMESDDALLDGSLSKALGIPVRGSTSDRTMGEYSLLAIGTGGEMVQKRTNVIEGGIVLAGYHLEAWDVNGDGGYAGGRPVRLVVPQYGFDGVVVPTEITFKDGRTELKLDNIRTADRSEVANSMGLTEDAVSNSAYTETVHIFARIRDYQTDVMGGRIIAATFPITLWAGGSSISVTQSGTITVDSAGYCHVSAYLAPDPTGHPQGWATTPVDTVAIGYNPQLQAGQLCATLDAPVPILAGQGVHVDVRFRYR